MSEQILGMIVVVVCGTVVGLAALWKKKNLEFWVSAKQFGVGLRVMEPGHRLASIASDDSQAQSKAALGVRGEAE
ncbi:hypothetical protein [Longimicrobium sp.]|jgi:hypothetical protein|uniref:hypothetical protein n=1 Tax=Longimicrobium sp. TaxID=2029185 RepID=UPI002F9360E5